MAATLDQQIARLEALPDQTQARSGTAAELAYAIGVLQDHHRDRLARQTLERDQTCLCELIDSLNERLAASVTALEGAISQRDGFEIECQKMLKLYSSERQKSDARLLTLERVNSAAQEELKALRALNPQRLSKQVKELQARNKAQTEANGLQREQLAAFKKAAKDYKVVAAANIQLREDNGLLDAALTNAARDISNANRIAPLVELGDWGIYPDEQEGRLVVIDKSTGAARPYSAAEQLAKIRPVPAKVQARCAQVLGELAQIRATLPDYREAV